MLEIGMDPQLVGGITWHGLFTALGVAMAVVIVARLARVHGVDPNTVFSTATWAIPGGIIGSRIVHVIDSWDFYKNRPEKVFYFWDGGVALFGAILGGVIVGVAYAWYRRYPVARLADLTAPAMLVAQAVGRVGDVINGEHFSKITGLPWAWVHTHPDWFGIDAGLDPRPLAEDGSPIGYHPSVAYEMMGDILLFFIIWRLIGRLSPPGMVMLVYLSAYSLLRFGIQFTRADPERLGLLQQAHIISLVVLVASLLLMAYLLSRPKAQARDPEVRG